MNKTMLVAKWEFMRNFKWKQELIGYAAMLAIYLVIFAVQVWDQTSQQARIEIGIVGGELSAPMGDKFTLSEISVELSQSQLFEILDKNELDAILKQEENTFTLYASQQSKWHGELEQDLSDFYQLELLNSLSISQSQLDNLLDPIDFTFISKAKADSGADTQILGLMAAILSAIAVFTSFGLCLSSVTQEKQQRVTEQLLTCLSHQQWVDGKTLGLCLSSLKSVFTTALFSLVIFLVIAAITQEPNMLAGITPMLLIQVLLFCTLGIVLWNYVFVGFSATIDDINHSGKTGVMFLPMVPVILVFFVLGEPNGQVATILSMFPLTSVSFMPMRLASMDVPTWQVIVSLASLGLGILVVRLYAFRIFRANITLFGKEPGWGEIWRSMLTR